MSIVVWDGTSLVADRQATCADMKIECQKIHLLRGLTNTIVAFTGNIGEGLVLVDWVRNGQKKEEWPEFQKDNDRWCRLIIVIRNLVVMYETEPMPIPQYGPFNAWGSGRDFAMGALAMGANAVEAVEITCRFSTTCGLGFDVFRL